MWSAPPQPMLLVAAIALSASCTQQALPTLKGRIVDIWGTPIQGAMVKIVDMPERQITDSHGQFTLTYTAGTHTLKAGLPGYIQEDVNVVLPEDPSAAESPILKLYPIPEEKGFHVIGSNSYIHLKAKPVRSYGNNLESRYGILEPGTASVDGTKLRFVYHGDLRQDQLMSLNVSLHALEFVPKTDLIGITTQEVDLNLHVATEEIELEVDRLKSRNNYLFQSATTLERGRVYALTTNDLLTPPDAEAFYRIAPPLRVAFPVELR